MKFYEFPTSYKSVDRITRSLGVRLGSQLETYAWMIDRAMSRLDITDEGSATTFNQWLSEHDWIKLGRPFYSVYPGIVPYLCRLKEDKVLVEHVKMPVAPLAFRFSEDEKFFDFDWLGKTIKLKSVLVTDYKDARHFQTGAIERAFTIWLDWGETDNLGDPVFSYYKALFRNGQTVEQAFTDLPVYHTAEMGIQIPPEKTLDALRCVISCSLISQNKEDGLIEPVVLNVDIDKFDKTGDLKYIDKAKRRGKFGWKVGEHLEVNPHYRGPSPLALYWTGKGGKIPLYRYRRGTIVHRKKISELPTGYED